MTLRLLAVLAIATTACRTGHNYADAVAPRWVGPVPAVSVPPASDSVIRVVSFNIQYAKAIDSALAVLRGEPALQDADLVLLQEMDADGTQRIAAALGMGYVYYPAIHFYRFDRGFGNAILSRWPIVADEKLILPHHSRVGGTQRIAAAATVRVQDTDVRVYSTHFGTIADLGPGGRRDQLRAILADADRFGAVVIGGDMNSGSVGRYAVESGYAWPTATGFRTARLGMRYDHFYIKGFAAVPAGGVGMIADLRRSSDHHPIWVDLVRR